MSQWRTGLLTYQATALPLAFRKALHPLQLCCLLNRSNAQPGHLSFECTSRRVLLEMLQKDQMPQNKPRQRSHQVHTTIFVI